MTFIQRKRRKPRSASDEVFQQERKTKLYTHENGFLMGRKGMGWWYRDFGWKQDVPDSAFFHSNILIICKCFINIRLLSQNQKANPNSDMKSFMVKTVFMDETI